MAVQKTTIPRKEEIVSKFYIVDAEGKILGRLASKVAGVLRGKNRPDFTPSLNTGNKVIVINADKIRVTGKKMTDKYYDRYTGFHSGLKRVRYSDMIAKHPVKVLELAIKRMIPHGKLGDRLRNSLYVYAGSAHPHKAQKPEVLDI